MKAIEFKLNSHLGGEVELKSFLGKNIVLFFYPKDNTPGWVVEANDFQGKISEFEKYNKEIIIKLQQALNYHNLDINLLDPADSKGKKHPLGVYDPDEFYKEFITLGAKKYCDKTQDDKIHITVSGVNKCGAAAVHDLKDFKKGLCFDYNTSGKKLLTYNDEQPDLTVTDYQDHKTKISQKYGINLAPTEYNLGISIDYETYINDTLHYGGFWWNKNFIDWLILKRKMHSTIFF